MNPEQVERLLSLLGSIAASLEHLAAGEQDPDATPDWVMPIESYNGFDWAAHNCTVLATDDDGPTLVQWAGKIFKRRSPENAYDPAIWFSRCTGGKDLEGRNKYVRLITFKQFKSDAVQPIGRKAEKLIAQAPRPQPKPEPEPKPPPALTADEEFDALPTASTSRPADPPAAASGKSTPAAALIGGVNTAFTLWAAEFVRRHPAYQISKTDASPDIWHLLKTAARLGYARISPDNLAAVCAALEKHAGSKRA